jgi:hypothetical protein
MQAVTSAVVTDAAISDIPNYGDRKCMTVSDIRDLVLGQ